MADSNRFFVIEVVGLLLVIIGLGFTGYQIMQTNRVHVDTLEWNKKVLTLEKLEHRQNILKTDVLKQLNFRDSQGAIPLSRIQEIIANPEYESDLVRFLNYNNGLARNLEKGILDEETLLSRRSVIAMSYLRLQRYVEMRREMTGRKVFGSLERFAKRKFNDDVFRQLNLLDEFDEFNEEQHVPFG